MTFFNTRPGKLYQLLLCTSDCFFPTRMLVGLHVIGS